MGGFEVTITITETAKFKAYGISKEVLEKTIIQQLEAGMIQLNVTETKINITPVQK